jgi:threonine aldolase
MYDDSVAVNQELWERCKQQKCETETNTNMVFKRVEFRSVKAKSGSLRKLKFIIWPELTKKDFGGPLLIPKNLVRLVCPKETKQEDIIPDYKDYLQQSMILHAGILSS